MSFGVVSQAQSYKLLFVVCGRSMSSWPVQTPVADNVGMLKTFGAVFKKNSNIK